MDRCPSCGIDVREDELICVNCGVQLRALKVEKEEEEEKKSPCVWVFFFIILPMLIFMLVIMFIPGLF